MFSITLLSGLILTGSFASADDSVVDNISITVTASCTMEGTGQNSHNTEIINGTYVDDIGTTTLKAFCNDSNGFAIYAIGYTGEEYGVTNLVGTNTGTTITTGTATTAGNPDISNWAMKLGTISSPTPTYPITIDNGFSSYSQVPSTYTKVAHRDSGTDTGTNAEGSTLTTTYAAYISKTQIADTYNGKVKYTMVHPANETPLQPQTAQSGCINYFPNGSGVIGTMGCQSIGASDTEATLLASNFSRSGYGFAGWNDKFDYTGNFYGPNEEIAFTAGQYTGTNNGLSLYAIWVKSVGNLQDTSKVSQLCGTGVGSLAQTDYNSTTGELSATLSSVSALTDNRDNQTYAIAKLADGNCWMIENLRLDNTAELTLANTNNPLNDGTNVTLKHNFVDTVTYNTLSATSNVAYDEVTAPDGWCVTDSAACDDQSRLRTDNVSNRVSYVSNQTMSTNANHYSYGNYYNWYSATAGRGTYSKSNGDTNGDLCPLGWKLPYGFIGTSGDTLGGTSGGFSYLDIQMGGTGQVNSINSITNTSMSTYWRDFPNNFIYSGFVRGDSLLSRGSSGHYWSSTAYASSAFDFIVYDSGIAPGTGFTSKYDGWSIRCLVSGS